MTASEPEPRSFGKQVVLGGLLDHLCRRLGPENVRVVLVGRADVERPPTPYRLTVVEKPSAVEQARSAATRVFFPPFSSLQEAALWSPRVLEELRTLLDDIGADLEIWDTMRMGQYAQRLPRRRRVLYADDLFSLRYASMLERIRTDRTRLPNPLGEFGRMLPGPARKVAAHPWGYTPLLRLERRRTARSEARAPAAFDGTALVSAAETAELAARTGSRTIRTLLPLIRVRAQRPRHFDGSPTFVFLGGLDFPPNRDGLAWFLGHAKDEVLAAVPDFRLLVVGRGSDTAMPDEAAAWGDHVQALGWVDDLDEVLSSAAGLLSPLRIGSGTKIKVLEALARSLPVVATPHGVLGLSVDAGDGCLIAEQPEGLAAHLAAAAEPHRNTILSEAAGKAWSERFRPEVASRAYDELLSLPSGVAGP
ncbi:hypothetical protein GCM10009616_07380 [Microlunatus lacustris]